MKKLMTMMLILSSLSVFAGMDGGGYDLIQHKQEIAQEQARDLDSVPEMDSESVEEFRKETPYFSFNEKI